MLKEVIETYVSKPFFKIKKVIDISQKISYKAQSACKSLNSFLEDTNQKEEVEEIEVKN